MNASQQREDLRRNGFIQGDRGSTGFRCVDCGRGIGGSMSWWKKISYEYDEWDCWCRECANRNLHQYDTYDDPLADFREGGAK